MSRPPRIVTAGYMPLDIVAMDGRLSHHAGGTAANVAAILAFFGWDAVLAGQVGDDRAGRKLLSDLTAAGVHTDQVHVAHRMETPRLVHSVEAAGHSFRYSCFRCQRALPRSRPLTIEQARGCIDAHPSAEVFFFDRANAGTLLLAEHYALMGSVVVYEPSVPVNAESLGRAVSVAHVVKHSDDRAVGGLDDLGMPPRSGQIRIKTHGAEGLEMRLGSGRSRRLSALSTVAIDAGGAGDWTTAGFLHRVATSGTLGVRHEALVAGLRFGQALAALSCTTPGARGLMRLSRRTVIEHATRAIASAGVVHPPRVPGLAELRGVRGGCAVCLMPLAPKSDMGAREVDVAPISAVTRH